MKRLLRLVVFAAFAICGWVLLFGALNGWWASAIRAESGPDAGITRDPTFRCDFRAITITASGLGATPGISDTLPGGTRSRIVRYASTASGVISLTVTLEFTSTYCDLGSTAAFGQDLRIRRLTLDNPTVVISYPVETVYPAPITVTLQINPQSADFFPPAALTFIRAVTPVVTVQAPSTVCARTTTPIPVTWGDIRDTDITTYTVTTYHNGVPTAWLRNTRETSSTYTAMKTGIYSFTVHARNVIGYSQDGESADVHVRLCPKAYLPVVFKDYPRRWFVYLPSVLNIYPLWPPTGAAATITEDAADTVYAQDVSLQLHADALDPSRVTTMTLRNAPSGGAWSPFVYATAAEWRLADSASGVYTVEARFTSNYGLVSEVVHDTIYLALNGGFDRSDFTPWAAAGEMASYPHVDSPPDHTNKKSALLGKPDSPNQGGVVVGNARLSYALNVPSSGTPKLTLSYRIFTYDHIWGEVSKKYWDSFEVHIFPDNDLRLDYWNGQNTPADDARRHQLCRSQAGTPDTTAEGLVLCDGEAGPAGETERPELPWQTRVLDLSRWKGQTITLYLANFNRHDGWYNTWTYVEGISISGW